MSLQTGVYHRLAMDPAVRASGAGVYRDFAAGVASLPFVVIQEVTAGPTYHLGGVASYQDPIYQTMVYASSPEERARVGTAVRDCLEDYTGRIDEIDCRTIMMISGGDGVDMVDDGSEAAAYWRRQDFRVMAFT